jgi:membrane fusion protein, multidrug efflux system
MYSKQIMVCLAAALMTFSCKKNDEVVQEETKEYPVLKVALKDTIVSRNYVTDIQAKKNIEIRSRMSGLIQSIAVNEGQSVKKGQLLFKINDSELQMELLKANASLNQTKAEIKIAEIEVKQLQSLYDKQFIAKNELDLAKAKLQAAKAKNGIIEAEKQAVIQKIGFTNIRAPFDGIIDVIPFKEGSLVTDGDLLTTLSQLDEIYAYFSIPENRYFELVSQDKLGKHHKIELVLPSGIKYQYNGSLTTAESEIDPTTGTIRYKVAFPNPDHLIKHGTSGKLEISEYKTNTILVPKKSTFSIQDKTYVFVVDKANKVKMKSIDAAQVIGDYFIVANGLANGETIVYEGTQSIKDGDIIKVKK